MAVSSDARSVAPSAPQRAQRTHTVLVIAAYALFLALNSLTLWSLSVFVDGGVLGADAQVPLSFSCFLGNALSYYVIAVLASRSEHARKAPFTMAVAGLIGGFSVLVVSYLAGISLTVAFVIAGLAIGTGSTCCFFCFASIFSAQDPVVVKHEVLIGSALMILPSALSTVIPDTWILMVMACVLMPASLVLLSRALHGYADAAGVSGDDHTEDAAEANVPDARSHGISAALKVIWPSLLCVAMIAIICPTVNVVSTLQTASMSSMFLLAWGDSLATVGILAVVWFIAKRRVTIVSLYLVVVPVVATTFLLWPFLGQDFGFLLMAVGAAGFCLISVVAVISSLQIAAEHGLGLYTVFGLIMGTLYSTRILGTLLGNAVKAAGFSEQLQVAAVAFLLLYGFSVVGYIVLRHGRRVAQQMPGEGTDGVAADASAQHPEVQAVDVVALRCAEVAREYRLSERTAQVMELLVRGRSVPAIAKTLYLSENTVRTHTKRVYTALDIHTRQELLDLVESVDIDAHVDVEH